MTTKQIDYCIEVARTLNFSRAADNLFCQPADLFLSDQAAGRGGRFYNL